jgi:hypothetical protein
MLSADAPDHISSIQKSALISVLTFKVCVTIFGLAARTFRQLQLARAD